jgi:hypothetical protein
MFHPSDSYTMDHGSRFSHILYEEKTILVFAVWSIKGE